MAYSCQKVKVRAWFLCEISLYTQVGEHHLKMTTVQHLLNQKCQNEYHQWNKELKKPFKKMPWFAMFAYVVPKILTFEKQEKMRKLLS